MDPITVTHLVQDRTEDLQRTADQVRRERTLRSTVAAVVAATPTRATDARRSPAPSRANGCAPAEPAA